MNELNLQNGMTSEIRTLGMYGWFAPEWEARKEKELTLIALDKAFQNTEK